MPKLAENPRKIPDRLTDASLENNCYEPDDTASNSGLQKNKQPMRGPAIAPTAAINFTSPAPIPRTRYRGR